MMRLILTFALITLTVSAQSASTHSLDAVQAMMSEAFDTRELESDSGHGPEPDFFASLAGPLLETATNVSSMLSISPEKSNSNQLGLDLTDRWLIRTHGSRAPCPELA